MDPSVAPPGKHVISMFVQYAPYHLKEGPETWPGKREAFGDTVVETLAEYCPGVEDSILYRQVITPWDMEQEWGLTEGNIFQGELSLEQLLFQRPAAGWSRYRTPIQHLWMCGAGTHLNVLVSQCKFVLEPLLFLYRREPFLLELKGLVRPLTGLQLAAEVRLRHDLLAPAGTVGL